MVYECYLEQGVCLRLKEPLLIQKQKKKKKKVKIYS